MAIPTDRFSAVNKGKYGKINLNHAYKTQNFVHLEHTFAITDRGMQSHDSATHNMMRFQQIQKSESWTKKKLFSYFYILYTFISFSIKPYILRANYGGFVSY
jgi:hypothetical protein